MARRYAHPLARRMMKLKYVGGPMERSLGKNYLAELEELPVTYDWAATAPIDSLGVAIEAASPFDLLAVGSGGSFTTAVHAASLHERAAGRFAKALTPLELAESSTPLR